MIQDKTIVTGTPIYRFVLFPMTMGDSAKCSMTRGGGNLRPRRPPLPASTSANTPANGNQRFHLRTESLWIPVTKPGRTPPIKPTWAFKP